MFDKTEELLSWSGSTQLLTGRDVPGRCIEKLQVLTPASQSGTRTWRIWHFVSILYSGKLKNHRRAGRLDLGFGWGKLPSLLLVLKSGRLMGAVAKGLVRRMSATAECDRGASSKAICLTLHVDELDLPFDTQRAITPNDDFG
jgi:hypothetical protein